MPALLAPSSNVTFAEIARVWHRNPEELPADVDPAGVEVTSGFRPSPDNSPFSYATHACVIALDPELGQVEILDYVISEDCGTIVNPMIVDGQIIGGALQGVGTALCEESRYDGDGNLIFDVCRLHHAGVDASAQVTARPSGNTLAADGIRRETRRRRCHTTTSCHR